MPRTLWKCSTIVAAFQLHLAAATRPVTTTVTVTPSVRVLAERVGLDPARERARFTAEIIRRVYSPPPARQQPTGVVVDAHEMLDGDEPVRVDVPLSADVWSQAMFRRQVPGDELLATMLADRRAALVAYGLLGTDDESLAFYGEHRALLTDLYDHAPGACAAYASSLRVHGGRLVLPGGEEAVPLWQTVLHVPVTEPEAALRALFLEPEARTAHLADVLTSASPESRAFALGLWMDDASLRAHRFQALHLAVRSAFHEWHVEERPFARPLNDRALLLLRVRVDAIGAPAPPAERTYWQQVWDAGLAALQAGDYPKAEASFKSALATDAENTSVLAYLAGVFAAVGRDDHSTGAWQTSLVDGSDLPQIYAWLTDALMREHRYAEARGTLEEAMAKWPGDLRFVRPMALIAATFGEGPQAVRLPRT